MVNLPRYENYKNSGVEWLGEIPEHWTIKRLGFEAFTIVPMRDKPTDLSGEIPWIRIEDFSGKYIQASKSGQGVSHKTVKNMNLKIFPEGTVLCSCSCSMGTTAIAKSPMISNQTFIGINPFRSFTSDYLYYFLNSSKDYLTQISTGAIQQYLSKDDFRNLRLPAPPIAEQKRIAEFLDRKCGEIDEAIRKKQRLIELLEEQKTILINQAVTKGLNPDAPMKDSGIDWLGEIPEHWKIQRAKYLLREVDERSQTGQEELLSVSHVTGVTPRSEKNVNMFMAEDYTGSKLCKKNDLVINIMWAWMGALGVSPQLGIISPSYGVFREINDNTFNPWFLEHLLRSKEYVSQYNRVSTGLHSSRLRLYADTFLKIPIIFPSKKEQDQIEAQVKYQLSKINQVIDQTQKQIEKLTELKQILIAEAVTGKIKV